MDIVEILMYGTTIAVTTVVVVGLRAGLKDMRDTPPAIVQAATTAPEAPPENITPIVAPSTSDYPSRTRIPPDLPQPFGYKSLWLAVKDVAPEQVCAALNLEHVREMGWEKGLELARKDQVFVSPRMGDWVLVTSMTLPDTGGSGHPNLAVPFAKELSRKLDTVVQSFATHRVSEYHHWIWAEKGHIRRAYGYLGESGEVTVNEGEPTPEEIALDIVYAADTGARLADEDGRYPEEDNVVELAGRWSIDPSTLGEDGVRVGTGWAGTY